MPPRNLNENRPYPEVGALRDLAHLLALEIYVRCADGNVEGAIDSLVEGLQFGQRIQGESWISGLSSIVSEISVLRAVGAHLDQLSEYQCRRVQHSAEEWLQSPSSAATMLMQRKMELLHRLDTRRTDAHALLTAIKASLADPAGAEGDGLETIRPYALQHPEDLAGMLNRAASLATKYYDAAILNLSLPVPRRVPPAFPKGDTPECKLLALIMSETSYSTNAYDALEARVRLLGIHAAIHRYQWEYSRLPKSLADLHLGVLNTDPFTANSFLYKQHGAAYDLSSFGPMPRGNPQSSASTPTQPIRL